MLYTCNRSLVVSCLPLLIFSSACSARPECDSIDTRKAVLEYISEDKNNPLVDYAARNATDSASKNDASKTAGKPQKSEDAKPLYQLGQRIVTDETSKDKSTLKCSGALSVSVGDLKATKEVNFSVQQSADGKLSVAVEPFQF